jgi:hypothetical protein
MTDRDTTDGRVTLAQGLVGARTHIVFIFGLLTAGGIIIASDRVTGEAGAAAFAVRRSGTPTAAEREAAAWAWSAASRSTNAADLSRARALALTLGVRPGESLTGSALSPSGGLAALEDLSAASAKPAPSTTTAP